MKPKHYLIGAGVTILVILAIKQFGPKIGLRPVADRI